MKSELINNLNWRYAVKKFDSSKKISQSDMDILLESLRLTASSFGLQLWEFVLVKNPEVRAKLTEKSWGQKQISEASDLIVLCCKTKVEQSHIDDYVASMAKIQSKELESLDGFKKVVAGFVDKKSPEQLDLWMGNQVYIALGNLLTTAAVMKIDSCPMEGIIKSAYDEILGLEKMGLKSVVACPIGYRSVDDKYATTPKVRFPTDRVIRVIE